MLTTLENYGSNGELGLRAGIGESEALQIRFISKCFSERFELEGAVGPYGHLYSRGVGS
jgi:hypothetical protein